jgi:hypothetical protein
VSKAIAAGWFPVLTLLPGSGTKFFAVWAQDRRNLKRDHVGVASSSTREESSRALDDVSEMSEEMNKRVGELLRGLRMAEFIQE